jgi:hypothetical protein
LARGHRLCFSVEDEGHSSEHQAGRENVKWSEHQGRRGACGRQHAVLGKRCDSVLKRRAMKTPSVGWLHKRKRGPQYQTDCRGVTRPPRDFHYRREKRRTTAPSPRNVANSLPSRGAAIYDGPVVTAKCQTTRSCGTAPVRTAALRSRLAQWRPPHHR